MEQGAVIGPYRIERQIGAGGMGAVYLARHLQLDRRAAIKTLHREVATSPGLVRRFVDEARAATRIEHPGIVQVFDVGETDDGVAYIVMELLSGEPLSSRLERLGRLPPEQAIQIVQQTTDALGAAHRAGIIHRDLKPENLFLAADTAVPGGERVKVLDFGIAKLMEPGGISHTGTNMLMGTPPYMSPEQCRGGKHVDERSDIYSLGCILFQLVCGRPPFVYESIGEQIAAHLHESPPSPSSLAGPTALEPIIRRCLAKSPDERFASMADVAAALDRVQSGRAADEPVDSWTQSAEARFPPAQTPAPAAPRVAGRQPGPQHTHRRFKPWWLLAPVIIGVAATAIIASDMDSGSDIGTSSQPSPHPTELTYRVYVNRPTEGTLVIADVPVAGTWARHREREAVTFTWSGVLSNVADKLALRLPSLCGPTDIPLELGNNGLTYLRDDEQQRLKGDTGFGPIPVNTYPRSHIPTVAIWVDNVGEPARTLTVGQAIIEAPAGEKHRSVYLDWQACHTSTVAVRDGDRLLGEIEPNASHVIDPTGTRCYERGMKVYGTSSIGMGPSKSFADPAYLHNARRVEHVLADAPLSVQSEGGMPSTTRHYIKRAEDQERCKRPKK